MTSGTEGKEMKQTGKRNEIFLATKFGLTADPNRSVRGDPEYVRQQMEKSLSRLGVDYVDLYYFHRCGLAINMARGLAVLTHFMPFKG